ncbi:MAG: pyridoxamine 5'-phosphate oxidase family protein [Beijerinckiaceae bacterium]
MEDGLNGRALRYLRQHHVASLATFGGDGPWAAAVFYVSDGFTLYFLSSPTSRHCQNIARDPHVAATIQEDYADWPEIKGVQLEGMAIDISGEDEARARRLYGEKYPLVGMISQAPSAIVKAMARVRWYRLVPQRVYFIDNSVSFGHRDELDLSLS